MSQCSRYRKRYLLTYVADFRFENEAHNEALVRKSVTAGLTRRGASGREGPLRCCLERGWNCRYGVSGRLRLTAQAARSIIVSVEVSVEVMGWMAP